MLAGLPYAILPFALALFAAASPAGLDDAESATSPSAHSASSEQESAASTPANKAPAYGPVLPKPPKPAESKAPKAIGGRIKAADRCLPTAASAPGEIVVCGQRPEYRIDPDVMTAKRAVRSAGPPRPPELMKDTSCASVGPRGCGPQAGINLIAAASTAAEMAKRLSDGKEIGSMFRTDPQPTEYQLYVEAKRIREAKEAEAALAAKVKANQAESEARRAVAVAPK